MEIVNAGVKPSVDVEKRKYCDDQGGGTIVDFYRDFLFDGRTGALLSTRDVDIDGVAYVLVGTAIECPPGGFDMEKEHLCDNEGAGVTTEFIRTYVYNPTTGAILSTHDADLDGVAYVLQGTAEKCKPEAECYDFNGRQALPVTDALAINLTVPANSVYAELQVLGGNIAFTIDGVTTPLNTGAVGNIMFDCGYLKLGCGDGDNLGDVDELTNFDVIALDGTTPRLEINYFAKA